MIPSAGTDCAATPTPAFLLPGDVGRNDNKSAARGDSHGSEHVGHMTRPAVFCTGPLRKGLCGSPANGSQQLAKAAPAFGIRANLSWATSGALGRNIAIVHVDQAEPNLVPGGCYNDPLGLLWGFFSLLKGRPKSSSVIHNRNDWIWHTWL